MTPERLSEIKAHLAGEDLDLPRWIGETEELISAVEQLQKDLEYANNSIKNICATYNLCMSCEDEKPCGCEDR